LRGFCGLARFGRVACTGMRGDENVHLRWAKILTKLHAKATEVGGRVGINRGRKAPYFTRHFVVFLHSFHGLALVPWFHGFQALSPTYIACFVREAIAYCTHVWASEKSGICKTGSVLKGLKLNKML
jgi:hypothetical protein